MRGAETTWYIQTRKKMLSKPIQTKEWHLLKVNTTIYFPEWYIAGLQFPKQLKCIKHTSHEDS